MSTKEAGKRARSTKLDQPVARGQPRRQAVVSTQTEDVDGWQRPKRVWHVGCQTDEEVVATKNKFSLLDHEQPSKNKPSTDVDFCSCGYEPEELPDLRTLGIKPRRRKRNRPSKQRAIHQEPEEPPVAIQQA